MTLLQKYIQAALKKAKYEFDEDVQNYVGYVEELPVCCGRKEKALKRRVKSLKALLKAGFF